MPFSRIGVTLGDQVFDHRDHLRDIFGRARLMGGAAYADGIHIGVIPTDGFLGDLANRAPCFTGLRVDLVIHIGEIAHIGDMIFAVDMAQQPKQHIKHNRRAGIAEMGAVIDSWPANIEAQIRWINRGENLDFARHRIAKLDLTHRLDCPSP